MFYPFFITGMLLSGLIGGVIGQSRRIGFWVGFLISFFLGFIGWIIAAVYNGSSSSEGYDDWVREQELNKQISNSYEERKSNDFIKSADVLLKLNELRKEGVISESEFNEQKEKLLSK